MKLLSASAFLVLLGSVGFAQTPPPMPIWARAPSASGSFIVRLPQLVVSEAANLDDIQTDLASIRTLSGKQYAYDLLTGQQTEIPPDFYLIGYSRNSKTLFLYDREMNYYSRAWSASAAAKLAPPADMPDNQTQFLMSEDQLIAQSFKKQTARAWSPSGWVNYTMPMLERPKPGPLSVVFAPAFEGEKNDLIGNVLQLSTSPESPGAVVASGVISAMISSDGKRLIYMSQAHVFSCDINRLTPEEEAAMANAAAKTKAMSDAKQSALALLIFLSDNDDLLPENFQLSQVGPYIRDLSILNGFTFTYRGPRNFLTIENPAETELGFMPGPGGRAVAFADGHVKWFPDKK